MPTPRSAEPRLSRQKRSSAAERSTPRYGSKRQRWVPAEEQRAVMTSLPSDRSPSRMSRQRPVARFTTWAKEVPGGAKEGVGRGVVVCRGGGGGVVVRWAGLRVAE